MHWLIGDWTGVEYVAAKAALMYLTALIALRLGERRTLAQWTIIDFATAVAMGAIIGRTSLASNQSWVFGAVALVTLVVVHRAVSLLRFQPLLNKLTDHRVRVLVERGQIRPAELRRCGLTDNDLYAQLRQQGIFSLEDLRYVLYEAKGTISVVAEDPEVSDPPLVETGLQDSAGYP